LGALLVLLTWMWLSVFVVLFGAEINREAERQTRKDAAPDQSGSA
jgi:membrane protein